jgi:hypothetical protein
MTRDNAISLILTRIGQRQNDTTLTATAQLEMQFAQQELETGEKAELPWFLETEYEDPAFKTAAGTKTVAAPTGFLREIDELEANLFYYDSTLDTWTPISKVDYDEGRDQFEGEDDGAPQAYTLIGTDYRFFPTPDAEYPLRAMIYIADDVLSTNLENAWLKYAGKLLMGKAGAVVAGVHVRDDAAAAAFSAMAAAGMVALTRDNTARKEAGRMREMGVD